MGLERRTIGSLDCVVRLPRGEAKALLSLCHGFGAPGNDMVGLAEELKEISSVIDDHVAMMMPAAPIVMKEYGYDARAWWPIRFQDLQNAVESGDFSDLKHLIPEGLFEMRDRLKESISQLASELQLSSQECIVGGFSQGSMLSTELALTSTESYGGLIVWSGTLLSVDRWTLGAQKHVKLPVIQSHGMFDQVLPYDLAVELHDLLKSSGLPAQFVKFPQGHTITMEVLEQTAAFVEECVKGRD